MERQFKYFAFISYSSHDIVWGKRLQKKLEGYRMPATLCKEHKWKRKPINPIFFAPTDIQPGGLTAELQERLQASRNLIVICSPHSARSEWVGKEIAFFHSLGRSKNIYFFIIDGIPHSGNPENECFHPIVDALCIPEMLGVNIHEKIHRWSWLNRERAYIQLITKLLDIEFDSLWRRHRRRLIEKMIACTIGVIAFLTALLLTWKLNQPTDVSLSLREANNNSIPALPPLKDALVTIKVGEDIKKDTIAHLNDAARFLHVPHQYLGKDVNVKIVCKDYKDVDTVVCLNEAMTIEMHRDASIYGNVHFRLWDVDKERTVPNCLVVIDGREVLSDANGVVSVHIPLPQQKPSYHITSQEVLLLDSIVYMPCGNDDVIGLQRKP